MSDQSPRDVLPIPDAPFEGALPYDARDAAFAPIEPLRPPADAPNVLVILLDDVGFAASSAFGGPCATPTAERLAGQGLKYNRFHTTALCAPRANAAAEWLFDGSVRQVPRGAGLAVESHGAVQCLADRGRRIRILL